MNREGRDLDFSHIRLSYITHFYCNQNNIDSVISLLREYETLAILMARQKPGHVNMFFLSRARFMRFFGYDENFSGHYGREDNHFIFIMRRHGSKMCYLPTKYRAITRNLNRDKSYHNLVRNRQSPNYALLERKKQEVLDFGAEHGYSRSCLNFTWKFLANYERANKPKPKLCKWWYWRYLVGYS